MACFGHTNLLLNLNYADVYPYFKVCKNLCAGLSKHSQLGYVIILLLDIGDQKDKDGVLKHKIQHIHSVAISVFPIWQTLFQSTFKICII